MARFHQPSHTRASSVRILPRFPHSPLRPFTPDSPPIRPASIPLRPRFSPGFSPLLPRFFPSFRPRRFHNTPSRLNLRFWHQLFFSRAPNGAAKHATSPGNGVERASLWRWLGGALGWVRRPFGAGFWGDLAALYKQTLSILRSQLPSQPQLALSHLPSPNFFFRDSRSSILQPRSSILASPPRPVAQNK